MEITEPVVSSIQLQIGQKTETEINRLPQVMSMVHFPPPWTSTQEEVIKNECRFENTSAYPLLFRSASYVHR